MSHEEPREPRWALETIARVRSPYREKFGIPRQAGLVEAAVGWIVMLPPYDAPEMFAGLRDFSHIWVSFIFHGTRGRGWRRRVRPPRLGGNRRMGVFATRSPFRPNHLGLSLVELLAIEQGSGVRLRVAGLDLLDGTPVVDLKPYLPYADARPDALAGFAAERPADALPVRFTGPADRVLARRADGETLRRLIVQTLALDPRPAYRSEGESTRVYGLPLIDVDVRWRVRTGVVEVCELRPIR
jgi:tRNA-Thr(GGU) m(6)t(6)A37 methyltransferase TsaA